MVFSEVRVKPHSSQTKGMSLLVTILIDGTASILELSVTKVSARVIALIERPKSGEVIMLRILVDPRLHEMSVPSLTNSCASLSSLGV